MSEPKLIDANALNERFDKRIKWLRLDMHDQYSLGLYHGAVTDKDLISEIPIIASDVVPVRHGRWERTADGAALCTACKRKMNPSQYGYAFCSLCGAIMDGERKDGDGNG